MEILSFCVNIYDHFHQREAHYRHLDSRYVFSFVTDDDDEPTESVRKDVQTAKSNYVESDPRRGANFLALVIAICFCVHLVFIFLCSVLF